MTIFYTGMRGYSGNDDIDRANRMRLFQIFLACRHSPAAINGVIGMRSQAIATTALFAHRGMA